MNDNEKRSHPAFEVFQGATNGGMNTAWFWRLRSANGEIVAQSESYTRAEDAERGATAAARAASGVEWTGPEAEDVFCQRV